MKGNTTHKTIQLAITISVIMGASALSGCQTPAASEASTTQQEQQRQPNARGSAPDPAATQQEHDHEHISGQDQPHHTPPQNQNAQTEEPKLPIDDQPEPALPDTDNIEQEHRELRDILLAYSRNNAADSAEQCATFPMGHKACGGPEEYQVYSQKGMSASDIETLHQQVERYNQLDAALKITSGVVSNCQITPEPKIRFENGRCQAQLQF